MSFLAKTQSWLTNYLAGFSYFGLILGTLFFAAALTPSLLPREPLMQGLLAGVAFSCGYGVGKFLVWLWNYLELPQLGGAYTRTAKWLVSIFCFCLVIYFLWLATGWQNSIRMMMDMEPVTSARPLLVAFIAFALAAVLLAVSHWIGRMFNWVSARLKHFIPRRISNVLGVIIVLLMLASLIDGLLIKNVLSFMDNMYLQADHLTAQGINQPNNPLASGSTASLIGWDTIGKMGQDFVDKGPTKAVLTAFSGQEALDPLRIYVGLRSAETEKQRAELALAELLRTGGFDRSILIIATPTGTGWHDPKAVDPIEYLHNGDTAIVTMQYSYLPSWLTIIVDPNRSRRAAKSLFTEIYGYWAKLPKDNRPELYMYGMSLGALGAETSADPFAMLEDTIQGGLFAGPPFASTIWPILTQNRNPGSPYWLPTFRDGSLVRFTAEKNALDLPGATWGQARFVYIQHASDPMVFFSPDLLFEKPQWLIGERGPDISPDFEWYPIITFLQIAFDIQVSGRVPVGFSHVYSASSYIDGWLAVTNPQGWNLEEIERLKREFANTAAT